MWTIADIWVIIILISNYLLINYLNAAIAGFGTESQILESLNRPSYLQRPLYIQKTLYYLFKMTQGNYEPRIEMSLPRIDIIFVSKVNIRIVLKLCFPIPESAFLCQRIPNRVPDPDGSYSLSI